METNVPLFDAQLTTLEAAQQLGVSRRTITNWVNAGYMHPIKRLAGARGTYLFTAEEVARVARAPRARRRSK